jgi:CRISPR-associated protein (TIGR02584 family)
VRTAASDSREIILLGVVGMSPAVITETVWALAFPPRGVTPIVPHRVRLITTTEGVKHVEKLRAATPQFGGLSPWEAMRAALAKKRPEAAQRLHLENPRILAMRSPRGIDAELPDIRTPEENEAAADFILEAVHEITARPDQRLVATLAGGRKTMGALLYAAMNLVAREDDMLTHVLVKEPFDAPLVPPFWFPAARPTRHELRDRAGKVVRTVSSTEAGIELATVPFVPLRNRFHDLPEKARVGSFMRMVREMSGALAQDAARKVALKFPRAGRTLEIDGRAVEMENETQLAVLRWLCSVQDAEWIGADFGTAAVFFKAAHGIAPEQGRMNARWFAQAQAVQRKHTGQSPSLRLDDDVAGTITRTLNELRKRTRAAGVPWGPHPRKLTLPPFQIVS